MKKHANTFEAIDNAQLATISGGFGWKDVGNLVVNTSPPVVAARLIYEHGKKTGSSC